MSLINEAWRRIRSLRERQAMERGLDEELRFHIERQTEKNVRTGMHADEARAVGVRRRTGDKGARAR